MEVSLELVVLLLVVFLSSQVTYYLNQYFNLMYINTLIDACHKYASVKARMAEVYKPTQKPAQPPPQAAAQPVPRDEPRN